MFIPIWLVVGACVGIAAVVAVLAIDRANLIESDNRTRRYATKWVIATKKLKAERDILRERLVSLRVEAGDDWATVMTEELELLPRAIRPTQEEDC